MLDVMAGRKTYTEERRVAREALFDLSRNKNEYLSQFVSRRDLQFSAAASIGLTVLERLKGILLEEGSGLNEQGQQNLRDSYGFPKALRIPMGS
jgi:hypothetical protein